MVGTPVGGSLYARFGFRAPFIFGEICTAVDLILRLLIIERDAALTWGYDPATCQYISLTTDLESSASPHRSSDPVGPASSRPDPVQPTPETLVSSKQNTVALDFHAPSSTNLTISEVSLVRKPLPLLSVIRLLGQSPRAVVALIMSLVYGYVPITSRSSP